MKTGFVEDVGVDKKNQGIEGLRLSGRRDVAVVHQMGEKGRNCLRAEIGRVLFLMKEDETADPRGVGVFRVDGPATQADGGAVGLCAFTGISDPARVGFVGGRVGSQRAAGFLSGTHGLDADLYIVLYRDHCLGGV